MSDELEKTLVHALRALAQRESWRFYELREAIPDKLEDILLLLDKRGWIKVRLWEIGPRGPRPWSPWKSRIYANPGFVADFSKFLKKGLFSATPEARADASELQLTGEGRAELVKVRLTGTKPPKKPSGRRRKRAIRTMPTENELRVLELSSQRFTDRQIAHEMDISPGRVSQLRKAAGKRSAPPSRSISQSDTVSLLDHDGTAPKSKKRTRPPKDD